MWANRRRFLRGGLGLAGAGLLAACGLAGPPAPPSRMPRIGFLSVAPQPFYEAFREGLRDLGWADGQSLTIEYRFADGKADRLPALAEELAKLPVDLIVAPGAAAEAKRATEAIPIVVPLTSDLVEQGLIASLARPGGNVTGLSINNIQLAGKRLQLLKEAFPSVGRVGVLWNAANPNSAQQLAGAESAAQSLKVEIVSLGARGPEELDGALGSARTSGIDGLLAVDNPVLTAQRVRVIQAAAEGRWPAIYPARVWPESDGLMSYGPNFPDLLRRAAAYVDKILRGAKPADLPVEQPTTFDFVINLKAAAALGLGLNLPPPVLQQATEILQ